ncbi:MAG: hypothetical protein FJ295_08970 [Planctomycetes bacterium]|nr:hypothetical protein [Planctomycetota bacterium]
MCTPPLRTAVWMVLATCFLFGSPVQADHRLVLQGNNRLVILGRNGQVEWERAWGPIHDVWVLRNGNLMVQQGASKVVEIDIRTKEVVWSYDSGQQNGNAGKPIEVHAFQPLDQGRLMIAESGAGRIIEVDRAGKLLKEIRLRVEHPHPHTDTRLARKLANGNYLVCHEGDGAVREYSPDKADPIWEFRVPLFGKQPKDGHGPESFGNKCFAAVRLTGGNTLIATGNGHSVIEVTPGKEIVWKLDQHELPGITLAWVTTLEVLNNGNYVVGNCHAGPGQPLLIEVDPKTKTVVWKLDAFDAFGNSVSNSQLIDLDPPSRR